MINQMMTNTKAGTPNSHASTYFPTTLTSLFTDHNALYFSIDAALRDSDSVRFQRTTKWRFITNPSRLAPRGPDTRLNLFPLRRSIKLRLRRFGPILSASVLVSAPGNAMPLSKLQLFLALLLSALAVGSRAGTPASRDWTSMGGAGLSGAARWSVFLLLCFFFLSC